MTDKKIPMMGRAKTTNPPKNDVDQDEADPLVIDKVPSRAISFEDRGGEGSQDGQAEHKIAFKITQMKAKGFTGSGFLQSQCLLLRLTASSLLE
jgi:hypothetical protein